MPTPETLEELFEMPRHSITYSGRLYAINAQLKLPPWNPPVCAVWRGDDPGWLPPEQRKRWWKLRELLNELHAEHLRRQNEE